MLIYNANATFFIKMQNIFFSLRTWPIDRQKTSTKLKSITQPTQYILNSSMCHLKYKHCSYDTILNKISKPKKNVLSLY